MPQGIAGLIKWTNTLRDQMERNPSSLGIGSNPICNNLVNHVNTMNFKSKGFQDFKTHL